MKTLEKSILFLVLAYPAILPATVVQHASSACYSQAETITDGNQAADPNLAFCSSLAQDLDPVFGINNVTSSYGEANIPTGELKSFSSFAQKGTSLHRGGQVRTNSDVDLSVSSGIDTSIVTVNNGFAVLTTTFEGDFIGTFTDNSKANLFSYFYLESDFGGSPQTLGSSLIRYEIESARIGQALTPTIRSNLENGRSFYVNGPPGIDTTTVDNTISALNITDFGPTIVDGVQYANNRHVEITIEQAIELKQDWIDGLLDNITVNVIQGLDTNIYGDRYSNGFIIDFSHTMDAELSGVALENPDTKSGLVVFDSREHFEYSTAIPEPSIITLLSLGLAGMAYQQRKKRGVETMRTTSGETPHQ